MIIPNEDERLRLGKIVCYDYEKESIATKKFMNIFF